MTSYVAFISVLLLKSVFRIHNLIDCYRLRLFLVNHHLIVYINAMFYSFLHFYFSPSDFCLSVLFNSSFHHKKFCIYFIITRQLYTYEMRNEFIWVRIFIFGILITFLQNFVTGLFERPTHVSIHVVMLWI